MRIDIITIFPAMFEAVLGQSILKRAQQRDLVRIIVHDLRTYTHDKRRTVDDRPYGGGPGMVLKPEPLFEAVEAIEHEVHGDAGRSAQHCQVVLTAAQGQRLDQPLLGALSRYAHLVILCGHYEGVDERVRQALVDREVSLGDFVLTGGELPAMVIIDGVVRLLPGVVGHAEAVVHDSFSEGLLEHPHYTRPAVFRGMADPETLRRGNHRQVATWRKLQAVARTSANRPDLLT